VVLVNRLSASASEIFAGAMQDYERALVVGDRSFGKGTVQTLVPLTEGQLKITESKFYRISGDSTQHRGVVPDVSFPSVFDTAEIGESSLDHALNWDKISPIRHMKYDNFSPILPDLNKLFHQRSGKNPDFVFLEDQVELAQETRELKVLPLNEKARIALRNGQEEKALAIENKRRKAQGEELLTSLEKDSEEEDAIAAHDSEVDVEKDEENDEENDVLLIEAGHVLVDMLLLSNERFALQR
jgi:carboxyl-terminal processing protease